ncbi:MAG: sterol desaturase family protein [Planctomycetes bacterium]|nr:sterol desaturase family protein [Planctomycetota bacterium]
MTDPRFIKLGLIVGVLATLWVLESIMPQYLGRRDRLRHDARNLALGFINAAVVALIFASALALVAQQQWGLLHRIVLPAWARWIVAFVMFDAWMYAWHVANHKLPWLWRFHRVHHTETEMDASSAMRFHIVEIALSSLARLAVVPVLGLTLEQLLVYECVLEPVILFHHSNVRVPDRVDRLMRWLIVTPWVHWVHHSDVQPETDSNYGSVFSFWDRLFGTFRRRDDPTTIRQGLDGADPTESRSLLAMLAAPFRRK